MRKFVYTPDVNAYIATEDFGIIDVSADIINGSVTRRVNAVSSAELTLQNPQRKYLRTIKPMDRIVIYLTRIYKPTLVFSGYIDKAPYDQLFPGPVTLTASCTLKRLLYTFWDPGLPFVTRWLYQFGWTYDPATGNVLDGSRNLFNEDFSGGLGHLLRAVMRDVGGWPIQNTNTETNSVHVMELPPGFITKTQAMLNRQLQANADQQELIQNILDNLLTVDGVYTGASANQQTGQTFTSNKVDNNPLPTNVARRQWNATIYGEKFTGQPAISATAINTFLLAQKSPLAGEGAHFVASGIDHQLDPRILVAIAGQETSFGRTGNAGSLHNAWGIGPGKSYPSWAAGIEAAAANLDSPLYFGRGADTIDEIQQIWAPEGAANDPSNLNSNWRKGVRKFFAQLSGNPDLSVRTIGIPKKGDYAPQGKVGDVKVSNSDFFVDTSTQPGGAAQTQRGYTFRIKGNPYGDDSLIFRAIYDNNISPNQISIYVPGAGNKGSPQAANWRNKSLTLDTSFGRQPFTATTGTTKASAAGGYTNPFIKSTNLTPERTDQGIDYAGTGDIVAIGNGTVIGITQNWYLNQPFFWYQLTDGDHRGEFIYIAECIDILVSPGDQIKRGQTIARFNPSLGSNGIEIGFAQRNGNVLTPATSKDHANTVGGLKFARFMKSIGAPVRDDPGPGSGASNSGGTQAYGTTGVQLDQTQLTSLAASTVFGIELGFPAIADVLESEALAGKRALANDVPLFEWIEFMVKASGRNFMSTPTGDFLAFYPDYFNWSNQAPYLVISPIETIDLNIDLSDDELTTHVFTTGDTYIDGQITVLDKMASTVASVEETTTFNSLINVGQTFDPIKFLQRYGARPWQENRPEIKNSFLQFMYGWMVFLEKWSKQFYCNAEFTFLPELFPGTLVEFASKDLIMYVQEVTHNFDRSAGFTTSASLISPSTRGGNNPQMVLANGFKPTSTEVASRVGTQQ